MVGKLTTHVLDTAHGCPGVGIAIALWKLNINANADSKLLLKSMVTNHDGRTDEPLLVGEELETGVYELVFTVDEYFAQYSDYPEPVFLDQIPIRFGISDRTTHYHVPLLVSPWSYSTYRGS
ncbi:hydroxyisourate hydrolase [Xenococcus sp. PCC 7305]|uniref:hydroxyisourate hydrolase n=1 Tax=Xenococcus sp. PCC 7305 TaxID=102125 RepID=UPI0002AC0E9B|nr:hydroxyisourate hydrolase [Xenococcus sp. PCC 7305]ELS05380.1 hydroxyisourate hydrolase [Xenococcus sp. PCC 7305]